MKVRTRVGIIDRYLIREAALSWFAVTLVLLVLSRCGR